MYPVALMGAFLAIMAIAILLVRRSMRTTGIACQFCRNQRLTFFDELSDGQRSEILAYFRQHETRQPDETGIFVCLECMTVHDDFCGEKRSRMVDLAGLRLRARAFCKVCNALMQGCDPQAGEVRCRRCETPHQWAQYGSMGFRFFMPPADAPVLDRCRDYGAGIA